MTMDTNIMGDILLWHDFSVVKHCFRRQKPLGIHYYKSRRH
jgi:hypothetical protein